MTLSHKKILENELATLEKNKLESSARQFLQVHAENKVLKENIHDLESKVQSFELSTQMIQDEMNKGKEEQKTRELDLEKEIQQLKSELEKLKGKDDYQIRFLNPKYGLARPVF